MIVVAMLGACGESVTPGDPLLGRWRSDEQVVQYPTDASTAREVVEYTFAADGSFSFVATYRDGDDASDPLAGCTTIERHVGWRWVHLDAANEITITSVDGAQLTTERSGCRDPSRNRALDTGADPAFPPPYATIFAISGNDLVLTTEIPSRDPQPIHFVRVH